MCTDNVNVVEFRQMCVQTQFEQVIEIDKGKEKKDTKFDCLIMKNDK